MNAAVALFPSGAHTEISRTVLVAEESRFVGRLMSQMLRDAGHDALAVADGDQLNDVLDAHGVELILLDELLPGLDVATWLTAFRRRNPATTVVVATPFRDPAHREMLLAAGADDIVIKPYIPEDLVDRLQRHLDAEPDLALQWVRPTMPRLVEAGAAA